MLGRLWVPSSNYEFPKSGKRNLKFQITWTYEFPWLRYSKLHDGAYCLTCVLFPPSDGIGKGTHQLTGKLVVEKFDNWKKAKYSFKDHQNNHYHKLSQIKFDNYFAIKNKIFEPINIQINGALKKEIIENRNRLHPIIKTVLFCGQQGISLRGHRDSGPISLYKDENCVDNQGNFRELIRFRVDSGDHVLQNHLETSHKNASYLSPLIQNEIISTYNKLILKQLVDNVNKVKGFTILADETTDISNKEQMSLCVRYVYNKTIREDFLQFIEIHDMSGKGLADIILKSMSNIGLKTKYLTGQGYDGASSMSGRYNGVQKFIRDDHPEALYLHCSAHCLNLAITFSCKIPEIRNCMGTIQSINNFFGYPKRQNVLKLSIEEIFPLTNRFKLKNLCATRWVDRHDAVILFEELQPAILHALDKITQWIDADTSSSANQLITAIKQSNFQTALLILVKILSISFPLSRFLQKECLDLETAFEAASTVQQNIQRIRENCDEEFQNIFFSIETICKKFEITMSLPRQNKRQQHRCNIVSENLEHFYKISIFIPFLDNFLDQLNDRFLAHKSILSNFGCILPKKRMKISQEIRAMFKQLVETYQKIINECTDSNINDNILNGELDLWYTSHSASNEEKINAVDHYFSTNPEVYPIISKLLQIFITLPVSNATGERSFSTLRRLKTYLRNSTSQNRLNGLALMNIHRDITVTTDDIINELAKSSTRKLKINL